MSKLGLPGCKNSVKWFLNRVAEWILNNYKIYMTYIASDTLQTAVDWFAVKCLLSDSNCPELACRKGCAVFASKTFRKIGGWKQRANVWKNLEKMVVWEL